MVCVCQGEEVQFVWVEVRTNEGLSLENLGGQ
jgi:hypothetical protein